MGLLYRFIYTYTSIYLSGLVTAVAVFRNPNTIPFCLTLNLLTPTTVGARINP